MEPTNDTNRRARRFQIYIGIASQKTEVIARRTGLLSAGYEPKYYKNVTASSCGRLDLLTHQKEYNTTAVIGVGHISVFITRW